MLHGLQYIGKINALGVILYKSRKEVKISWDKPYKFTPNDDISDKARNYYITQYGPLGVRLIEEVDPEELIGSPEVFKSNANEEIQVAEEEPEEDTPVEESKEVEVKVEGLSEILVGLLKEIKLAVPDENVLKNISASDLALELDSRLSDEQITELADYLEVDTGRLRSRSKILNRVIEDKLGEIIDLIIGLPVGD